MRKIIILFLFFFSFNIFSQEREELFYRFDERYYYYDKFERDINASLRFLIPPPHESVFGFFCGNMGMGYGIIPEYYYIGAACDFALGFDWFRIFSGGENNSNERESYQLGLSLGFRLYNLVQIKNFRIWSFVGSDFLFVILPMPYAGLEITFKMIGLEYAYYFPIENGYPTRHRVSLIFRAPIDS